MFILSSGVHYHVQVMGEGKPIVFLHGFTGNIETWYRATEPLHNSYQCIYIDIIGHGETDSPNDFSSYHIETVAKDIIHILDTLVLPETHIVGYSMGGRLALAISILYSARVTSLVLESSSPGLRTEEERVARRKSDEQLANRIELDGIESFIDFWEKIPLFSSQQVLSKDRQQEIRNQRLKNNPIGLANSLRGMGTGSQPSFWDRLNELKLPTLLLCGELDQKFCRIAEEMSLSIQNAKVEKIVGVGHAIHVEQPSFFGKIINEFVSDHYST